jgi:hypothetical protein
LYFQKVEILHFVQDDRKTSFARGSKVISFCRGTASRALAVFLGHSTLCPYDQNRQSKKTFGLRYNSNDSAATAPEPFEIWGAIL